MFGMAFALGAEVLNSVGPLPIACRQITRNTRHGSSLDKLTGNGRIMVRMFPDVLPRCTFRASNGKLLENIMRGDIANNGGGCQSETE
jgi:hypothetical protein